MDLENFEDDDFADTSGSSFGQNISRDAQSVLDAFDDVFYTKVARRSRWMDLIGDYAGSEPFLVDGDALFQLVLDDPLLAMGRQDDPSFQLLHAKHTLESILHGLLKRSAVFEIVIFSDNSHATVKTGTSLFSLSSRTLARTLLLKHLNCLTNPKIAVHEFANATSSDWHAFRVKFKPMFVMTNDGGTAGNGEPSLILTQRLAIFDLLAQGVSIALLKGYELRSSKIFSFVYEGRLDPDAAKQFPRSFMASLKLVLQELQSCKSRIQTVLGLKRFVSQDTVPAAQDELLVLIARLLVGTTSDKDGLHRELLFAWLAHILALEQLSVNERAVDVPVLDDGLRVHLTTIFLPRLFVATNQVVGTSGIDIDIDGRFFCVLLTLLATNTSTNLGTILGSSVHLRLQSIWSSVYPNGRIDSLSVLAARYIFAPPLAQDPHTEAPVQLLPFRHALFDDVLSEIRVDIAENFAADNKSSMHAGFRLPGTVFADTKHWHNTNKTILPGHMGGQRPNAMTPWQRKKYLRSEQRFTATLHRQAASLTGASGALLERITIVAANEEVVQGRRCKTKVDTRPEPKNAGKKPKEKPLTSVQKTRLAIQQKKDAEQGSEGQNWWQRELATADKLSVSGRRAYTEKLMLNTKRTNDPTLLLEMRLHHVHLLLSEWVGSDDRENDPVCDRFTVLIMRTVKTMLDGRHMTATVEKHLRAVLATLGLSLFIDMMSPPYTLASDRPLAFEFIRIVKGKLKTTIYPFMRIREDPIVWQLRLFGEFMDRSMDSSSDDRVPFAPDAWQRDVLDAIDSDKSLLVVAPTSAGKTFISFYAMEKVLRRNDSDVIVYVAPTKALIMQIAAEVYARYSKKTKDGKSFWAVHTRDYRVHDAHNSQILITVPEMLAIMLLSPPLARTWTPRIRRIILDEIHTIGNQDGGAVWEQIVLLAPCPIIGLSATIGSPETFNKWLESVQKTHNFGHVFISHPHRYSHLRKHVYAIQLNKGISAPFRGLDMWTTTSAMRFLHPMATLSFGATVLPPDLALEASDTLTLSHALIRTAALSSNDLRRIDPTIFFAGCGALTQRDIIRFEQELKEVVSSLMALHDASDHSSPLGQVIRHLEDSRLSSIDERLLNIAPSRQAFRGNLIRLLADLHSTGDLPAILFNFDRTDCEVMGHDLLVVLKGAEEAWKATSVEWNDKLRQWEHWKSKSKDRGRQAARMVKQKRDDEDEPRESANEHVWQASFDPSEPSPQFSFASTRTKYSKEELKSDIDDLKRWTGTDTWVLEALRRGVAIHHAGMNKKYRSLVESLFRIGFLKIVIATGTLALGINAPAKTSVFCGDSPYLTALMYRQCAGRAGRRGYDTLGKVVFYGLAMDRVKRLVLSRLPSPTGNFPMTSTLTLRLMNLLHGSCDADVATAAIRSLLRLPQMSFGSDAGRMELLHHVRFSIDYLRRSGLLDAEGHPINLYGIAAHLYHTEPSNFALIALLREGVFHRICSKSVGEEEMKVGFLLILSHLFGRRYLPPSYFSQKLVEKSPSKVKLPSLPSAARHILLDEDKKILRTFTSYALTYVRQYAEELGQDDTLPLSQQSYAHVSEQEPSMIHAFTGEHALKFTVRSPFVATSGHTDHFSDVSELTRSSRAGLHLNEHAIPSLGRITALPDGVDSFGLNAYLLDFYMHGQVDALARANGIRRGDVWYLLQDFDLTIKTICGALKQILVQSNSETPEPAEEDLDSGYGTADRAEIDVDEFDDVNTAVEFPKPNGVAEEDWRVYTVFEMLSADFGEKFKAMWA